MAVFNGLDLTNVSRERISHSVIQHPILATSAAVFLFLIVRYVRNIYVWWHLQHGPQDSPRPRAPPYIPPTIPYVGHIISTAISYQGYTASLARRYDRCSVLTLPMLTAKHHLIIAPSLVHQVFTSRNITNKFSGEPFFFGLMETVFGDSDKLFRNMDQGILWGAVFKSVQGMMRESFLSPALAALNEGVSRRIFHFISSKSSPVDQETWEKAAKVSVVESNPRSAHVSLHPLLRDFVGHLAISILLGPDFLINYPDTLPDLFTLDSSLSLLLSGLPASIPALIPATEARTGLISSLRAHHIAHHKYTNNQDPGPSWPRISQTSNVMADRIAAFAAAGDFDPSQPESQQGMLSAIGNIVVLWALNVNANQVTFWMIYHLYSQPTLLAEIRDEIKPYVTLSSTSATNPKNEELAINLPALQKSCPLLAGAFLETMRHESGATIYRYIHEDFTMAESEEDAAVFGHGCPQTYVLKKGEYVCVPNGVHQSDERYFPNSGAFEARRFWVREGEEGEAKQPMEADMDEVERMEKNWNWRRGETRRNKPAATKGRGDGEGKQVRVDYKTMHPWGGGPTVCKGKKFAEGEVLTFVAAIVSCWDMERVDEKGRGVPWGPHPGHKNGTGAVVPKKDVRVKIWKREVTR